MPVAAPSIEIRGPVGIKHAIAFGSDGELFGLHHPAASSTRRGVGIVLVCPLGTDYTRSDRAYRHLAERLAASGFDVLRYDHYGTGDSAGDDAALELVRRWRDGVGDAVEALRERMGGTTIGLVGLRLGATLAMAHAAVRGDVDALVLWSPCTSGQAFVTEVVKLHKVYARIEPQMTAALPHDRDGEEALGLFLPRQVITDLAAIDLLAIEKLATPHTLVIDPGGLAGRDALLAKLTELGTTTELRTHTGQRFLAVISHRAQLPEDCLTSIVGWLDARYPQSAPPTTHATTRRPPSTRSEQPFVFGTDRPRFGILTPAAPTVSRHPRRPPIVLSNAGCVNRSGPHRFYTTLARRWAALGFDVLRVDLSGIGDTPAAPTTTENVTYPPGGLDDLRMAITALDAPRAIVIGLCSGGDYAFQLGAHSPELLETAVIMNPRTFCMLDLQAVESQDGTPPAQVVDNVPQTLRSIAGSGVNTLLVISRNDPGVAYVDAHWPEEMRALAGLERFTRIDIDGADHTFTPLSSRARVGDLVTEYLLQHHA